MTAWTPAHVGLGSNLSGPEQQVSTALAELAELPETRVCARSSLYRSAPLVPESGPIPQPNYINAVASLETRLSPYDLLDALQAIEGGHGRLRDGRRWGPRTLDLDLLLYGELQLNTPRLTLPHPGLAERAFVLYPLFECAPALVLPDGRTLRDLLAARSDAGLQRLDEIL